MINIRNLTAVFAMALALFSLGFLSGCGNDSGTETGTLRIRLTDTPYPLELIEKAEVTINKVEVHVSDSPMVTSGFLTVAEGTVQTFNLLDLQGGVTATLVDADLPAGTYNQIRLLVTSASVELTDGNTFPLTIPSGIQSGIKVFPDPPITVSGGLTTDLILDFDVSQSFSPIPNNATTVDAINDFQFNPVIRVVNASTAGSISGTVYSDEGTPDDTSDDVFLEDALLTVFDGTTAVTTTSSSPTGGYVLMGLPAGDYDVTATRSGYIESTITGVSVSAGNDTGGVDFTLEKE